MGSWTGPIVHWNMTSSDNDLKNGNDNAPESDQSASSTAGDERGAFELSAEELTLLRDKAAKADETWGRFVRLNADFDNFKKRTIREKEEALKYATEGLLERLVPVLDNFEMALMAATGPQSGGLESLRTGVTMTGSQLRSVLSDAGLEEISSEGQQFDPNWHEAVSQLETLDAPEGTVMQQLRKGYKLKGRLLRPALVVVAKSPSSQA